MKGVLKKFAQLTEKQLCAGTFYLAQVFSSECCKIVKNSNKSVEHLRKGACV